MLLFFISSFKSQFEFDSDNSYPGQAYLNITGSMRAWIGLAVVMRRTVLI